MESFSDSYQEAKEIVDFTPVQEEHDKAKKVIVDTDAKTIQTSKVVADYEKKMKEIDEIDLDILENAINQADLVMGLKVLFVFSD